MTTTGADGVPDRELVRRAREGDSSAFADLVRRHERRVYNLAYRILGRTEDARDATQDAFVSCFRHLDAFRGDAAFTTWMHRITVNACYDLVRRRGAEPVSDEEMPERLPSPDHADRTATSIDVQRALTRVPIEFRAVMVLHDVQGVPYEEIAKMLDVPIGTVKSRLHRGRVALGRTLSGEQATMSTPSNPATP